MGNTFNPQAAQAPAADTDAVCTMAAPAAPNRWVLDSIDWSYSATPDAGSSIVVSWSDPIVGALTRTYYISAGGPGVFAFPAPLRFPTAVAVTVTLAGGGTGILGTVYPNAHTEM